jgi:hypothetical protein
MEMGNKKLYLPQMMHMLFREIIMSDFYDVDETPRQ